MLLKKICMKIKLNKIIRKMLTEWIVMTKSKQTVLISCELKKIRNGKEKYNNKCCNYKGKDIWENVFYFSSFCNVYCKQQMIYVGNLKSFLI